MILPEERIEFERPYPFVEVDGRDETLCTVCGPESYPWPASELTAIKHHSVRREQGIWRLYCREHLLTDRGLPPEEPPKKKRTVRVAGAKSTGVPTGATTPRSTASKPQESAPAPEVICPDCWIVVPATGVCGVCGERVAR